MAENHNRFIAIATPGIANLKPYVPGKPVSELERELGITDAIKLASNENPLGCSEKARAAMVESLADAARYPDGGGFALRNTLAQRHQVAANCITLGNGSNDVLDMIARVFLGPGSESLFSQYAFAVYPISSQSVGATLKMVPAKAYGHDLDAMLAGVGENTRVVWVANPNNPTGTWVNAAELERFIAAIPQETIVVIDEAYIEYVEEADYPDSSQWLARYPNLIVTRTFSKVYGLASVRLGYALSHPDIADLLNRVRQPFNVNSMAMAAAIAALDDPDFVTQSIEMNRNGMAQMNAALEEMGVDFIPSVGNFVTVDVGRPVEEVDLALLKAGCIGRPLANYGMPQHLRITIGTERENSRFLAALKLVLGK